MSAIRDDPTYISLRLLDRRVVDADGEPLGRVDDLAFEQDADRPRLVGIFTGPEALGARLGGVLGDIVSAAGRLRPNGAGRPEVAIEHLGAVDIQVRLKAHRDDLPFPRSEGWVRDHVIGRIPGSQRSSSSGEMPGGSANRGAGSRPANSNTDPSHGSDSTASRLILASALLGTRVLDRDGHEIGKLRDLRLRRQGDDQRIEGLVTGRGVIAERFGYAYGEVSGPWLLVVLMRHLAKRTRYIPWDDIVQIASRHIVVRKTQDAYRSVAETP